MTEKIELVRGTDNPFRDVDLPDADTKLMKADLAAEILCILEDRGLTNVAAAALAGIQEADISRIRNADLARFSIERLVRVLNALGRRVSVKVRPRELEPT